MLRIIALGVITLLTVAVARADVNPDLPQIPSRDVNLADFGAVGDGKTMNTDAFAKAVGAVRDAGGGRLIVPKGQFLTLPFELTSHLDLHLDDGATIQFPADLSAYGLPGPRTDVTTAQMQALPTGLIGGTDLTDVAISGNGVIDGGGKAWWSIRGTAGTYRPKLVLLQNVQRFHVQDVTLRNSPMWNLVPTGCLDVLIERLHVEAPPTSHNTDAIDVNGCDTVLIRDCDLNEGDDNVAIKATDAPCINVLIENCRCMHGHGISIGSETYKGIHDVTVRNCTFDGTDNGIRIKSARDRGNDLYGFRFSDLTMKNVKTAITLNMYYQDKSGMRDRTSAPVTSSTPHLHDVQIKNVTASGGRNAGEIIGLPERVIEDVTLSNVSISAEKGMTFTDASGIVCQNMVITVPKGTPFNSENAHVTWIK